MLINYDGILGCEKIIIPIHLVDHWVLGVIHLKTKRIELLDSLGGANQGELQALSSCVRECASRAVG
jgi:Ulp1 family protease